MENKAYFHNIVHALSEIYFTSIYVDVEHDEYDAFQIAPWMKPYFSEHGQYSKLMDLIIAKTVVEQHRTLVKEHFSLENIRNKLNKEALSEIHHSFYMDYQSVRESQKHWVRATIALADSAQDGSPAHVICMLQDVTIDKNQATLDTVTGIYNRFHGMEMIQNMLDAPTFSQGLLAIIDIDNFKQVNDRLGHQKGDEALVLFANRLTRGFTERSVVFRLGGDEFGVFVETEDINAELKRFEQLREDMHLSITDGRRAVGVSGSLGIVEAPIYGHRFSELYAKADRALYYSKENGKNCITLYNPKMRIENDNNALIREFDYALANDEIQIYYHPIIRSITGEVCGLEALARWLHPKKGLLLPNDFISVLELKHQIQKLDLYIVRESCKSLCRAKRAGRRLVPISVNLSKFDFIDGSIFEKFERIVDEYQIDRKLINIEITESFTMENPTIMQEEITRFREAGHQVWLDDFGVGYSSLKLLQSYHFDLMKLDRAFMADFNEVSQNIAISVIAMAKKLGIHTLAEGVETKEQYEFLSRVGCEKIQGFYIGKPMLLLESLDQCEKNGMPRENIAWAEYYDEVIQVDFLTDRPLAVTDFDGETFHYLFINDAFRHIWFNAEENDADRICYEEYDKGSPLYGQFQEFLRSLVEKGKESERDFFVRENYIRLKGKSLCTIEGHTLSQIEINNVTKVTM